MKRVKETCTAAEKRHRASAVLPVIMAAVLYIAAPQKAEAGKIITESLQSKTLNAERHYNVYLPDGYDRNTKEKYPILYLLHGFTDDHRAWAEKGQLQIVADLLTAGGEIVPMVIVMPEAGGTPTDQIWNGYFDMPGWSYETFFFKEFMPYIEKRFRVYNDKKHRAVSGLSMGGGGSVAYCQKHPEQFCACYDFSGWLDQTIDDKTKNDNGKVAAVQKAVHDNSCIKFIEQADKTVIDRLRTVKWFVDCGDDDFLLALNEQFHMQMRTKGIHCEMRVRDGNHNWEYWHTGLYLSLPFISRSFAK